MVAAIYYELSRSGRDEYDNRREVGTSFDDRTGCPAEVLVSLHSISRSDVRSWGAGRVILVVVVVKQY